MLDTSVKLRDSLPDDDYLESNTIWIASLSNGETIYRDDTLNEYMWLDLKQYVEQNELSILSVRLKFRSHVVHLPNPQKCCFIGKAIGRWSTSLHNDHYLIYGTMCADGKICRDWYVCPSLIQTQSDIVHVDELHKNAVIWNYPAITGHNQDKHGLEKK